MPLYNFKCGCDQVMEHVVESSVEKVECSKCGMTATRSVSVPASPRIGKTQADGRIRDTMKRKPRPDNGGVMFSDRRGNRW